MKKKDIETVFTEIIWSDHIMVRYFASAGFSLATGQIIERDASPLSAADRPAARDVMVRPLKGQDIAAIDRIDTSLTGLDRSAYYASKFREMLDESGIRVSLVSESDGKVTGFIMARLDYGEFGKVAKAAVIDTIGVHPSYAGTGMGYQLLSQLLTNLAAIQVESVRTKVEYENAGLRDFLSSCGFKPSQRLLLTRKIH